MTEETLPPAPTSTPIQEATTEPEAPSTEFAAALAEHEQTSGALQAATAAATSLSPGTKVHAKIVRITDDNVLVDFGGRSEGVAEARHFRGDDGALTVSVGDELDLYVVESNEQIVLAPSLKAESKEALRQLREAMKSHMPVSGKVSGVNAGGVTVDVGGVRAFCPISQIDLGFVSDPSSYVGRTLEFLVTEVKDGRGGAVLSRRQLLKRGEEAAARERLASLKVGDELEGTVARLETFGAFIDLGGIDGLAHISEVSHSRVAHPKDVLRQGEKVRVRVLKLDAGKDGKPRVGLSIRAAMPDPWEGIAEKFQSGQRVEGVVARLADFGAFVTIAPGVDGLVHVSEAALTRIAHVKDVLAPGDKVEAIVREVDPAKRRVSLSIREALGGAPAAAAPSGGRAAGPEKKPTPGDVVEGVVRTIKPFGIFLDLPAYGPRVSGMLPREAAGEPRDTDLEARFPLGSTLQVQLDESRDGKLRLMLPGGTPAPRPGAREAQGDRPARADRGPRGGGGGGGPRGDRGPREGGPRRDRGDRGDRGGRDAAPRIVSSSTSTNEPTTMALALRKAMEAAKLKAGKGGA